jgi:hypothetical protein
MRNQGYTETSADTWRRKGVWISWRTDTNFAGTIVFSVRASGPMRDIAESQRVELVLLRSLLTGGNTTIQIRPQPKAQHHAPTPAVAPPPSSQPLFITELGTTTISPDKLWRVAVSPAGDTVEITRNESSQVLVGQKPQEADGPYEARSIIRVPNWRAHPGWFVFIENASQIWIYDGDRNLCLETSISDHSAFYPTPSSFPCPIPAQVFSRLSEAAKRSIGRHTRWW